MTVIKGHSAASEDKRGLSPPSSPSSSSPPPPQSICKKPRQMSPPVATRTARRACGAAITFIVMISAVMGGAAAAEAHRSRTPPPPLAFAHAVTSCAQQQASTPASSQDAAATAATRLVVGLGNPGAKYEMTRHNIGFMAVDAVVQRRGAPQYKPKWEGLHTEYVHDTNGFKVHALKPQTFMNLSGKSLAAALDALEIPPSQSMTVIDDINLPFGQIRIREKGSAGGHNGLKDIQLQLGSDAYARLRIGVGAVPQDSTLVEHVLGEFTKDEQAHLPEVVSRAADILELWASGEKWDKVQQFSGKVNSRKLSEGPATGSAKGKGKERDEAGETHDEDGGIIDSTDAAPRSRDSAPVEAS